MRGTEGKPGTLGLAHRPMKHGSSDGRASRESSMKTKSVLPIVLLCVLASSVEGSEGAREGYTEKATWQRPEAKARDVTDTRGGMQKWSFPTDGAVTSSPAVSNDGTTIFVGSHDTKVYALDASTGAQKWSFNDHGAVYSPPAVSNDGTIIYVRSNCNKMYALDASTGAQKWSVPTGDRVSGGAVVSSPAVSHDGATIYVGSYDTHKIYALDASTGAQKWSFPTGGSVCVCPERLDGCKEVVVPNW